MLQRGRTREDSRQKQTKIRVTTRFIYFGARRIGRSSMLILKRHSANGLETLDNA